MVADIAAAGNAACAPSPRAAPCAVELGPLALNTEFGREEAYMLLGLVGEPGIGTSPRPMMAGRLMIPRQVLADAGRYG